jgi:hypothetical protein
MSVVIRTVVAMAGLAVASGPALAQIVVDHQPTQRGGPAADTDFINMFGQRRWQLVADDFMLSSPAELRRVSAWGFYSEDNPPGQETMRIRFYDARPVDGLPGNILYEQEFTSFSRVATGRVVFVGILPREFFYTFDLPTPLALAAGTPYWFELTQLGDVTTTFRIETSGPSAEMHSFLNSAVTDWTPSTSNLAFQLSTIPEPASGCLLSALVLTAVAARRRSAGRIRDRTHSYPLEARSCSPNLQLSDSS